MRLEDIKKTQGTVGGKLEVRDTHFTMDRRDAIKKNGGSQRKSQRKCRKSENGESKSMKERWNGKRLGVIRSATRSENKNRKRGWGLGSKKVELFNDHAFPDRNSVGNLISHNQH